MSDERSYKIAVSLNTKNLPCPVPNLRIRMNLRKMQPGEILELITSADLAWDGIPDVCRKLQHKILHRSEKDGVITFIIQKKQ